MPGRSGDEHEQRLRIPLVGWAFMRLRVAVVSGPGSER
jgi:hypothetical protein